MTKWVRLWADMPTDPKWRVIARRAGRPISEVLSVFIFMMTNAGESSERGTLSGWDDEDVAAALDIDAEHVTAIRQAMQGKTLEGDSLTGWEKRQPNREDQSNERVRQFRERKSQEAKRDVTQCNASVTRCDAPDTDTDTDTDISSNEDITREATPLAILSECLTEQTAKDLITHRQAKRTKLTPRAARELVKAFRDYGDPEAAAAEMMLRGWTGFKSDWMQSKARAGPSQSKKGWGALWVELNGYGDGREAKRADENVSVLPRSAVDGNRNGDGDAGGVSGNLIELFAGDGR